MYFPLTLLLGWLQRSWVGFAAPDEAEPLLDDDSSDDLEAALEDVEDDEDLLLGREEELCFCAVLIASIGDSSDVLPA